MITLERFPVLTHVSPKAGDVLFYNVRDRILPKNRDVEYGEPHPDKANYPDHKLIFIAAHDEEGKEKWYYAKDREEQEDYNWNVSYPYNGLTNAPRYECVFILPREEYEALAKGTRHPLDLGDDTPDDNTRFKDALLVFETEVSTGDQKLDSLYVAVQRIYDKVPSITEQLVHNIEKTFPFGGLKTNPQFTRTLIIPRQSFIPVSKGTPDPVLPSALLFAEKQADVDDQIIESLYVIVVRKYADIPNLEQQNTYNASYSYPYQGNSSYPRTNRDYIVLRANLGEVILPPLDPVDGASVFAFRRVSRFEGSELDSIFVRVDAAYDRIPDLTDDDDLDFLRSFGYQITRPYGTKDHPRLTWRVPSPKAGFDRTTEYTDCPVVGYESLKLTDESVDNPVDNPASLALVRVYDTFPGPELIQSSQQHMAGIPDKFISKKVLTETRQPVKNDTGLAAVGGDPRDVGGAVLQTNVGPSGNNQVIHTRGGTRLEVDVSGLVGWEMDPLTGISLPVVQTIVAAGTSGADVDANGNYSDVTPINPFFSVKTARKSTSMAGGNNLNYDTVVNYAWPAVLRTINFFEVIAHRDGVEYTERYGYDYTMKESYSGPCDARVEEKWSKTPVSASANVSMRPEAMAFDFPLTRVFSIPKCLHGSVSISEVIGTEHPHYPYTTTSKTFAATNYTDWPASMVASFTQTPFRGGFRSKKIIVDAP